MPEFFETLYIAFSFRNYPFRFSYLKQPSSHLKYRCFQPVPHVVQKPGFCGREKRGLPELARALEKYTIV